MRKSSTTLRQILDYTLKDSLLSLVRRLAGLVVEEVIRLWKQDIVEIECLLSYFGGASSIITL